MNRDLAKTVRFFMLLIQLNEVINFGNSGRQDKTSDDYEFLAIHVDVINVMP